MLQTPLKPHPYFDFNPSIQQAICNRDSCRIGKIMCGTNNWQYCPYNGRNITHIPKFQCLETQEQLQSRYGKYGPNCVIYFGLLHRITIFIFICASVLAPTLISLNLNFQGSFCVQNIQCSSFNVFYSISIFNIVKNKQYLKVQTYIWLGVSILICLFSLYLRYYTVRTFQRVNNRYDSEGDYSVIIRRIPPQTSEKEIRQFIKYCVCNQILERKKAIQERRLSKKLTESQIKQLSEKVEEQLEIQQILRPVKLQSYFKRLQQKRQQLRKMSEQDREIELAKDEYKNISLSENQQQTDIAVVIFKRISANDQIHEITNSLFLKSLQCPILPMTLQPCFRTRQQLKIKDTKVIINRAPQPSDLLWLNIGYTQCQRLKRKIIFTIASLMCIGVSGLASFYIYKLQKIYNYYAVTITMVLVMQIFNFVLTLILDRFGRAKKFETVTELLCQKIYYNVLFQSVNLGFFNLLIPYLCELPNPQEGLTQANFPTFMVTTMLISLVKVIIGFLYSLSELKHFIVIKLFKEKLLLQTTFELNQSLKGEKVPFEKKQADWVKYFWFGLIFGIISPICILLSSIMFVLYCITERILFNSIYSIPEHTRISAPLTVVNLFQVTSMLIGLTNLAVHQLLKQVVKTQPSGQMTSAIAANIIISSIFVLTPWDKILERLNISIFSDPTKVYKERQKYFELTYKNANPIKSLNFIPKFQEILNTNNSEKVKIIDQFSVCKLSTGREPDEFHAYLGSDRKFYF